MFEDVTDDCNSICPYCGYSYQVEGEDYSENRQEIECGECGKSYWLVTNFSVSHTSTPDCKLNGEAHQWRPRNLRDGRTHDFCAVCDKCRPLTEDNE